MKHKNEGTKRSYGTYAKKYSAFCKSNKLGPTDQSSLCLHLKQGFEQGLGRGTLTSTIPAAVADMFRFCAKSPTKNSDGNNTLLKQMKETIRRLTPKPEQKKPIKRDHLIRMVKLMKPNGDAKEIRDMCILIFMFIGFLRESEAMQLLFTDVSMTSQHEDGMELGNSIIIVVRKSKTDKYSENATIVLAECPGHPLCPVWWYKRYLKWRNKGTNFFTGTGGGKPLGCQLANTTPNHIIKMWLKLIGVDPKLYGSHSLRRGGCTAAMLTKVNLHTIKNHGRWKSDAVYLYMVDDMDAKLNLTRAVVLGGRA